MGPEFERAELNDVAQRVRSAGEEATEEVWASYRFVTLGDSQADNGLKTIDLGAGYSRGNDTLTERVISALKSNALLNESVGAGYIGRNWPPALRDSGVWPLGSLRQSFLNGSLTRLLDPDRVLRQKIAEFVENGDFGLASGEKQPGEFARIWYQETPPSDEVTFDSGTFLVTKARAELTKAKPEEPPEPGPEPGPNDQPAPGPEPAPPPTGEQTAYANAPEGDTAPAGDRAAGELEHGGNQDTAQAPVRRGTDPGNRPIRSGRRGNGPEP